jgi:hypothetical protein
MNKQRHTQDGLPIVSEGVWEVYCRDRISKMKKADDQGRIELNSGDLSGYMEKENPVLTQASNLSALTGLSTKEQWEHCYKLGFLMCYGLLKRQAEVNNLEEQIER